MLDTTSYPGVNVELHEADGWILMQRKILFGSAYKESFERNWAQYRDGFGDGSPSSDDNYWLGLEHVYRLTQLGANKLRVEVGQCFTVYNFCVEVHTVR